MVLDYVHRTQVMMSKTTRNLRSKILCDVDDWCMGDLKYFRCSSRLDLGANAGITK